jgi:hypothetical protein
MDYFEEHAPSGDGLCDDDSCPCCPSTVIQRGSAYLYIADNLVKWRRPHPREADAEMAMRQAGEQRLSKKYRDEILGGAKVFGNFGRVPFLCASEGRNCASLTSILPLPTPNAGGGRAKFLSVQPPGNRGGGSGNVPVAHSTMKGSI